MTLDVRSESLFECWARMRRTVRSCGVNRLSQCLDATVVCRLVLGFLIVRDWGRLVVTNVGESGIAVWGRGEVWDKRSSRRGEASLRAGEMLLRLVLQDERMRSR